MIRRVTIELEHMVQFQGETIQQFEREQDAGETRPIGSMQSPAGPAPPEWMTRGYDGSVMPQESIASHPLMTAISLSGSTAHDRKRFTIGITVHGPPDTPWDRSLLHMLCVTPQDYPFRPPYLCFCSGDFADPRDCKYSPEALKAIPFHPNVSEGGRVNLEILRNDWTPVFIIPKLVGACVNALTERSEECIINPEADRKYRASKEQWEREARERIEEDWRVD